MALIIQKFGGTSVGSIERIREVARRALDTQEQGHQPILVVSAMSGETNRLVDLAKQINPIPYSREYDVLIASGEQISVGLVSLAINAEAQKRGLISEHCPYKARPLLGHQIGILTDSVFSKARIRAIKTDLIFKELEKSVIPVIAGFQGVDPENNITTLGRGGSDTSAVAIAIALKADDCEIYTDVDGVYTTDPRICSNARKINRISYEEMMELASLGAKVLQIRSVELAAKYKMPIHVRSSFNLSEGTKVLSQELLGNDLEQVVVSGIATDLSQIKFTLQNLPEKPGVAAEIFNALSKESIVVDVIVQDVSSAGHLTISFTVSNDDQLKTKKVLDSLTNFKNMNIILEKDLAKVSIVGVGMQHHPGVASKMFTLLGEQGINIKLITTSEIKVSCLINSNQIKQAVACLHSGFGLDR